MGNVLGFVRMMRQAGLRHCSAALCIADGRKAPPDDLRAPDHPDSEEVSVALPPCMHHVSGSSIRVVRCQLAHVLLPCYVFARAW